MSGIHIASFEGIGYQDVGRQAFAWAATHRGIDPARWRERERWDGGRIADHPDAPGYEVRAWTIGRGVSAVLEAVPSRT